MNNYYASPLLLFFGFLIGITSGFYGLGGGWLSTPILNILGLPMPYAIGTSLVYIVSNAILGTLMHNKLKNVNYLLGLIIGSSSIFGVIIGKTFVSFLEKTESADTILRYIYIIFLFSMSLYIFFENKFKFSHQNKKNASLPPIINIKISDNSILRISIFKILFIGILTGLASSLMGIGGGFLLLPFLIYIIKIPVKLAIGTNLFTVVITVVFGSALYALSNQVNYLSAIYLIIGTTLGVRIGVYATKYVDSEKLKFLLGLTILAAGISVFLKQLRFVTISKIFILCISVLSALTIIYISYVKNKMK